MGYIDAGSYTRIKNDNDPFWFEQNRPTRSVPVPGWHHVSDTGRQRVKEYGNPFTEGPLDQSLHIVERKLIDRKTSSQVLSAENLETMQQYSDFCKTCLESKKNSI